MGEIPLTKDIQNSYVKVLQSDEIVISEDVKIHFSEGLQTEYHSPEEYLNEFEEFIPEEYPIAIHDITPNRIIGEKIMTTKNKYEIKNKLKPNLKAEKTLPSIKRYARMGPLEIELTYEEMKHFFEESKKINYNEILKRMPNCLEKARKLKAKRVEYANISNK